MADITLQITLENNRLQIEGEGLERVTGRQVRMIEKQIRRAIHRKRRALSLIKAQDKIKAETLAKERAREEAEKVFASKETKKSTMHNDSVLNEDGINEVARDVITELQHSSSEEPLDYLRD